MPPHSVGTATLFLKCLHAASLHFLRYMCNFKLYEKLQKNFIKFLF